MSKVKYIKPVSAIATSLHSITGYDAINAFNPYLSLIGSYRYTSWSSNSAIGIGQKLNAAYSEPGILKRLVINNSHNEGITKYGIKDVILYGTNVEAAYLNTVYANTDDLTELHSFTLREHISSDVADPEEIALPVITQPFKYYIFRIVNGYDVEFRIVRQVDMYFENYESVIYKKINEHFEESLGDYVKVAGVQQESQENYIKLDGRWRDKPFVGIEGILPKYVNGQNLKITSGIISVSGKSSITFNGITKHIDTAWAEGSAAGSMLDAAPVANHYVNIFLIEKATGELDVATATSDFPVFPAGWNQKVYLGFINRTAAILPFTFKEIGEEEIEMSLNTAYSIVTWGTGATTNDYYANFDLSWVAPWSKLLTATTALGGSCVTSGATSCTWSYQRYLNQDGNLSQATAEWKTNSNSLFKGHLHVNHLSCSSMSLYCNASKFKMRREV